jgi:formylmethanofuran dehydrogenase subunit A
VDICRAIIFDPLGGTSGATKDIFISEGRISAQAGSGETIEADGLVAMAGGIDIHTHLSSTRNRLSGFSAQEIAELYRSIGYTHVVEAGVAPSERDDFLGLSKNLPIGCSMLELVCDKAVREVSKKFLAKKYIGERGMELLLDSEETYPPPHIHLPRLGLPGSIDVLTDFIKKLAGKRCHISHIAYYIFRENDKGEPVPKVKEVVGLLEKNKNISFDLGPPTFGKSLAYTADPELAARVARVARSTGSAGGIDSVGDADVTGTVDVTGTAGDGAGWSAVEYEFRKERFYDSLFWLSAMELILGLKDFSRASLSIDFPSGGSIEGYPLIIASLMSVDVRNHFAKKLNEKALAVSSLLANERELSLWEIAQLTRSSPASACGFSGRGHLGIGADADVVLYRRDSNLEKMFRNPAYVIRKGEVVVRDGKPV